MSKRWWICFIMGLLAIAAVFSHPLACHFTEGMPYSFMPVPGHELLHQYPGDNIQLMYRFWLFKKALTGAIPYFSNYFEFSTPLTPPTFTTQGIPISFVFILFTPFGNIAAYNVLVILSFLAAGVAMALLVRELTGSPGAAAVCGFLYSCMPYRLGHLYGGHMGGFIFFLPPLALYCFERAWRAASDAPPAGRRAFAWGFGCGLCFLGAAPAELHLAFFMGILLALYFLLRFTEHAFRRGVCSALRTSRPTLCGLLAPVAVTVGYLLWVKFCYLAATTVSGGRSLRTVQAYSPGLRDIFRKSPNAEKNIFLGLLPLLCAVYGFFARRGEISRGRAGPGELLRLYFWAALFAATYLMSLGTTLEAHVPLYSWLHAHIPFVAYSRTSSRIVSLSLIGFLPLVGYGVKGLLAKGRAGSGAVTLLTMLALADYHPKGPIGVSILRGMDSVYEQVRREAHGRRLLELPLWPGDSAWSALYGYYVTLTGVPIVNGYNPVPRLSYITRVFEPMKSLNLGEMRKGQYDMLRAWDVPFIILHQDLFPRKVSPYPFRFTLLNLMESPYLRFVRSDGPSCLFALRENPASPEARFTRRSPVGNLYPARRMKSDVGNCIPDDAASSGFSMCAGTQGKVPGLLMRGAPRLYPTGEYRVSFHLKCDAPRGSGPVARIDVYAPEDDTVLAERTLTQRDFSSPGNYRLFELGFANAAPARVEFRVHYLGAGVLRADFAYVVFSSERDPCPRYEAEDLFHIGSCVEDADASGGHAVAISNREDIRMPMVSGPERLYPPGRYRARYYLRAKECEGGVVASLAVTSGFGGAAIATRDCMRGEIAGGDRFAPCDLSFELARTTPVSFTLRHFNRASLGLDRIEVEKLDGG